ncbi:MAG TPA: T9SS type A sorting domain-containing protein [Saprospiraceae bacterium]|nr:T9SS type A sorting domain-containing protein [Saprospiraceae bacterium]
MKCFSIMISLYILTNTVNAQITITHTTFPTVGDTLRYILSNDSTTLNLGTTNGPQEWNFSSLSSGIRFNEIYTEVSNGKEIASFPEANLLLITEGQEQYLKSNSTRLEVIGLGGFNALVDTLLLINYSKRPTIRNAPLTFIKSTSSNSEFRVDISSNLLPTAIKNLIPINFDSIRIQFSSNAKGIVDAYGTLKMQNKDFSVLRETIETVSETKIFLKIFGFWIDPLPLFVGNIPSGIDDLLGQDTTITYNFYTDKRKEILVSAQYNTNLTLRRLVFADLGGLLSTTKNIANSTLKLFPNPATEKLFLQTQNIKEGKYVLTISDFFGRTVYDESFLLSPNDIKEINISNLNRGTYLMYIKDHYGILIHTIKFLAE